MAKPGLYLLKLSNHQLAPVDHNRARGPAVCLTPCRVWSERQKTPDPASQELISSVGSQALHRTHKRTASLLLAACAILYDPPALLT